MRAGVWLTARGGKGGGGSKRGLGNIFYFAGIVCGGIEFFLKSLTFLGLALEKFI